MEMLIATGGVIFWALFLLFSVAIISAIEFDKPVWATGFVIVGFLVLQFLTPYNPVAWIWQNQFTAFTYLVVYFLAGTLWAFAKWLFHVYRIRNKAVKLKEEWTSGNHQAPFAEWIVRQPDYREKSYPPQVSQNKGKLSFWATYWPWNAFWTLLNDPIRMAWRAIYNTFGRFLQNITDGIFKNV